MPEPLILKVQADTKGVPEGFNRITKSTDSLDLSSRKASNAMKGFIQDLSQAKSGADVASAALSAFSRVLGTSIAATGIAIAAKVVIDTFSKIGETVNQTKERIESATADIKKSGLDVSFGQAAGEAKRLSDEADNARKNIEKLDKSFLAGIVATITGAREELGKLAQEADQLSQQRLFEGARAERQRAEARAGLGGPELEIRDIEERLARELAGVRLTTPEGIRAAAELRKRAELDIEAVRQKEFQKFDVEQAQIRLKQIDAEIKGRADAERIARNNQEKADEESRKRILQLQEERSKKEKEIAEYRMRLEKDATELNINQLDLEERLLDQRQRIIQAEGKVSELGLRGPGTGRGTGQKPTSLEIGAFNRAQKAAQDEAFKLRQTERERIKTELQGEEIRRRMLAGERLGNELPKISGFDVNRRLEENFKKALRAEERSAYDDARNARAGAQATEDTLRKVKENLQKVLDELKTYAHAT